MNGKLAKSVLLKYADNLKDERKDDIVYAASLLDAAYDKESFRFPWMKEKEPFLDTMLKERREKGAPAPKPTKNVAPEKANAYHQLTSLIYNPKSEVSRALQVLKSKAPKAEQIIDKYTSKWQRTGDQLTGGLASKAASEEKESAEDINTALIRVLDNFSKKYKGQESALIGDIGDKLKALQSAVSPYREQMLPTNKERAQTRKQFETEMKEDQRAEDKAVKDQERAKRMEEFKEHDDAINNFLKAFLRSSKIDKTNITQLPKDIQRDLGKMWADLRKLYKIKSKDQKDKTQKEPGRLEVDLDYIPPQDDQPPASAQVVKVADEESPLDLSQSNDFMDNLSVGYDKVASTDELRNLENLWDSDKI